MDFGSMFSGIGSMLGGAGRGIGNLFSQGAGAIGNAASQGANFLGQGLGKIGGGISSLFGGGGSGGGGNPSLSGPGIAGGYNPASGQKMGGGPSGGGGGGFGNIFGNKGFAPILGGLGTMFGSQLIGNPKPPALPASFNQFQQQANAGGPPIEQQSNQYLSTLLSGQNTAANDAATHSLDLNYQEQLRQLNGMYKSLRPGTDPTSDTTYQRDLSNLNDQYTRQRAQVLAQQQMGAAQQGIGAGAQQASQQQSAIETQVSQIAAQYQLDAEQKQQLRQMLMGLGGNLASYGAISSLFPNALGGGRQ